MLGIRKTPNQAEQGGREGVPRKRDETCWQYNFIQIYDNLFYFGKEIISLGILMSYMSDYVTMSQAIAQVSFCYTTALIHFQTEAVLGVIQIIGLYEVVCYNMVLFPEWECDIGIKRNGFQISEVVTIKNILDLVMIFIRILWHIWKDQRFEKFVNVFYFLFFSFWEIFTFR